MRYRGFEPLSDKGLSVSEEIEKIQSSPNKKSPKKSQRKVVISAEHLIEVYEYEEGVWSDFEGQGGRKVKGEEESERVEENRRLTCRRAREMIRRICLANFSDQTKFITLTYKENQTDIDQSNVDFKAFMRRLRRQYGDFKYVAVIEFQERGAVHYHVMSDLPYIPNKQLNGMWKMGFVRINKIDHVDNVGAYMVKYMLKDMDDPRLKGRKAYLTSKGLKRPITVRGKLADDMIEAIGLEEKEKVYEGSYPSEHHGNVVYSEYNLKRHK